MTVKMFLPAWLGHLEEMFSYKEFSSKVLSTCENQLHSAEYVNKTPVNGFNPKINFNIILITYNWGGKVEHTLNLFKTPLAFLPIHV